MLASLGRLAFIALALTGIGCSGGEDENTPAAHRNGFCRDATPGLIAAAGDPSDPVDPLTEEPIADSSCNAVERSYPIAPSPHVTDCTPVEFGTNPPSSGNHYPTYPKYAVYGDPIPRGFWVHAMEHGGVVFTYSCTNCGTEVDQAKALIGSIDPSPLCNSVPNCGGPPSNQVLMTPDPGIPTKWAAASWGFTLTADCFEPAVFENFVMLHRDNASPELICDNDCAKDVSLPGPK